ncbi:DUF29 family protein [Roseomonas sp. BN140053]|uniref:DUF29 family protein n=1 Tax=Roseomonas sp. BN140053 TaxID=3391898 RepID=UPI0039EA0256
MMPAVATEPGTARRIPGAGSDEWHDLSGLLQSVIVTLLRWQLQPAGRCDAWRLALRSDRREAARCLRDHPVLDAVLHEVVAEAYALALPRARAALGPAAASLPADCPFWPTEILDPNHLPGAGRS